MTTTSTTIARLLSDRQRDVANAAIARNPTTGEPGATLTEINAALVAAHLPPFADETEAEMVLMGAPNEAEGLAALNALQTMAAANADLAVCLHYEIKRRRVSALALIVRRMSGKGASELVAYAQAAIPDVKIEELAVVMEEYVMARRADAAAVSALLAERTKLRLVPPPDLPPAA